jgi:predicted 3-demethylubiquinone-9 3-methyltransferase (glyoxalase superfamily)
MQKIHPCLWFDGQAEQAAKFYTSIFRNSRIGRILRTGDAGPGPKGSVLTIEFELDGETFMGLNGGPEFSFTPAISIVVNCDTQTEVDGYWDKLLPGGKPQQCGWLTDRFGVSWQIVPKVLPEMLMDQDAARAARVMNAMMNMIKLDIATLQQAYDGA